MRACRGSKAGVEDPTACSRFHLMLSVWLAKVFLLVRCLKVALVSHKASLSTRPWLSLFKHKRSDAVDKEVAGRCPVCQAFLLK